MLFPFKNNNTQKAFSFVVSCYGLFLFAIGINSTIAFQFFSLGISFTAVGMIITMMGLLYFTESIFSG